MTTSLRNRHSDGEKTGNFPLYPNPHLSVSPTVRWESGDAKIPANESGTIEKVLDCYGGWLHKENQCPSQVTTCP